MAKKANLFRSAPVITRLKGAERGGPTREIGLKISRVSFYGRPMG